MPFMPFLSRPEPDVVYVDVVQASAQIGSVEIYVTKRGIGIEQVDDKEDSKTEDEEVEE